MSTFSPSGCHPQSGTEAWAAPSSPLALSLQVEVREVRRGRLCRLGVGRSQPWRVQAQRRGDGAALTVARHIQHVAAQPCGRVLAAGRPRRLSLKRGLSATAPNLRRQCL